MFFDATRGVNMPTYKRQVGFIFQQPSLFPHLTVEENIRYGAGTSDGIPDLLNRFNIDTLKFRYPREISGGEQQRVALARSLASRPRLLLLDEPFSALDEQVRARFREDLLQVKMEEGMPMLMVTHSLSEAFALADRLIVIDEGHVVESYDTVHLFSRPRKRITAELLGVQNLVPCVVRGIHEGHMVVAADTFEVMVDPDDRYQAGDRVWLGIRSVDVRLVVSDAPRENEVEVTIQRIIPSVASNQIFLHVEGSLQTHDLIMDLDEHHCTQHMIKQGDRIRVALKRSKVFLCD
jgi:molybdate transport system ATP-binding protein